MTKKIFGILVLAFLLVALAVPGFSLTADEAMDKLSGLLKESVLEKHPEWPAEAVKVSFKYSESTFKFITDRKGKVDLAIAYDYSGFDPVGDVMVPVRVYVDGKEAEKVYLRAKVVVWLDVVAANDKLSKKSIVEPGDLTMARKDVGRMPQNYFLDKKEIVGKQILSSISKGTVIQDWMLRTPPEVSKYDEVKVTVKMPSLKVTAVGVALDDGYEGDKIKIRNKDTKREFTALVVSTGEVSVDI